MKVKNKCAYFDFASATPIDGEVLSVLNRHLKNSFGNAGSFSQEGREAKAVLDESRRIVADALGASPSEVFFTGGGTEANNMAFFGVLGALERAGLPFDSMHIVVSGIEHSSVMECANEARRRGASVSYVKPDGDGIVSSEAVKKVLSKKTVFVSVMKANNEIGTIQPTAEISKMLRGVAKRGFFAHSDLLSRLFGAGQPVFHSDWSQAALYLPFEASRNGIALATFDGQKIYGPKGIGALFVRRGVGLVPIIFGGGQENGLRSGTENVPLIAGLARAFSLAVRRLGKDGKRLFSMRDGLFRKISAIFPEARINGHKEARLPNNLSLYLPGINAEFLAVAMDADGVSVSTKSACLESEESSYVLRSIGLVEREARSVIRVTLGRTTGTEDIKSFLKAFKRALELQKEIGR